MPIIDVSGLMSSEREKKVYIRKDLKVFFKTLGFSEDSTTVTFDTDDTTGPEEHVMARMYSKKFMQMEVLELERMCDSVVAVLEKAGHPFNEAFPVPVLAMRGRPNKQNH
ncbi:MAG: hypothetical protein UR66_C0004G0047 [Candidatus Moranbacteria bacterium GW2011_GWE1_35_17]|nr:MAG: hypothetical protein UR66_C0004G0047 [Candidatus Moranbacteria bacterium GW2011_GWE1_35_17]KKP72861.1 MAG: hypothetical protein UR65_C0011G0011 [Candidatus Moranbacteria bacterium GW2011_GWE2_35_164]KKP84082.1 MAG: hypothetical protein UR82_C0013G0009 [Candidatus Moranbacteria bacterium GW2011_GWF1_35_5]KKP85038.1 MAG: hypothetical protein UR83_C0006G0040 [Candidatus Moranbacteria bacterium GW2011_GWF2_35_54]